MNENPIEIIRPDGGYTSIFRTIGVIGDSLASGEHESFSIEKNAKGFHDYYEYSWGQFIARTCGSKVINFSKGGMTAVQFFDFTKSDPKFDIYNPDNRCQCYIIALGVNDMNRLTERYPESGFGSFDDVDLTNPDNNKVSYVGQYVRIIQELRKLSPKCRIFLVSMPDEANFNDAQREKWAKVSNALNVVASKFEYIYVVDLFKYAPKIDKEFRYKYFLGGHLSSIGYKFFGDMISTYISYIIEHNIDDFRQVGFIDRGVHNELEKW